MPVDYHSANGDCEMFLLLDVKGSHKAGRENSFTPKALANSSPGLAQPWDLCSYNQGRNPDLSGLRQINSDINIPGLSPTLGWIWPTLSA
jgi:hypothetical protein